MRGSHRSRVIPFTFAVATVAGLFQTLSPSQTWNICFPILICYLHALRIASSQLSPPECYEHHWVGHWGLTLARMVSSLFYSPNRFPLMFEGLYSIGIHCYCE